jgi:hypothetical protein
MSIIHSKSQMLIRLPPTLRISLLFQFRLMIVACLRLYTDQCGKKACKLFHNSLVSDIPGMPNGEIVASNSTPQKPHIVSVLQCGKFTCDCVNYKSKHLCSHVIVSAESCGTLSSGFLVLTRSQVYGNSLKAQEYPNIQEVNQVNNTREEKSQHQHFLQKELSSLFPLSVVHLQ